MHIHHEEEWGRRQDALPPERSLADPAVRQAVQKILCDVSLRGMCDEVANTLGVSVEAVAELVTLANAGEYLFHGVKRGGAFHDIRVKGILPITPEGDASYWTSGMQLFGDPKGKNPIDRFFNSTFFNYAHVSYDREQSSGPAMVVAVARAREVRGHEASFSMQPDAELAVHEALPPGDISLIHVECAKDQEDGARWVQQKMFEALLKEVRGDFHPGNLITYKPENPLSSKESLYVRASA